MEQMVVFQTDVASRLALWLLVPVPTSLVGGTTSTVASAPTVVVVLLLEVTLRLLVSALCLVDLKVALASHVQ